MKKLESSLVNMAVVLTIIAIVAGGALAYVNNVTTPQIKKINETFNHFRNVKRYYI